MPKYRQLHTKIIDSFDFNEMPNDFTRIVWLLLMVILDSEGRGIDNMAWLRSKMFPLRDDVSLEQLENTFEWLADRKMIIRYYVGGKSYFYIPTFLEYQTGTNKEAPSNFPPPPAEGNQNSGQTPDQLLSSSGVTPPQYNTRQYNADAEAIHVLSKITSFTSFPARDRDNTLGLFKDLISAHRENTVNYLQPFYSEWIRRKYRKTNFGWLDWAVTGEIPPYAGAKKDPLIPEGYSQL